MIQSAEWIQDAIFSWNARKGAGFGTVGIVLQAKWARAVKW
jgi:hypothetical protein